MNIALLGYGKMGKVIEQIAINRGHNITLIVDQHTQNLELSNVDVAIDFSMPESAFNNLKTCFENNTSVVCGTTGWLEQYEEAVALCKASKSGFIYASNFSLGVNIFFEVNKVLAKLMKNQSQYNISLEEIHHTQKLDAPSGTAISLAEDVISNSNYEQWQLDQAGAGIIPITAIREPEVPGTHTVDYTSEVDTISITHQAHNRMGFALGAVIAAEWLHGKQGVYSMKDVLDIN
ncbi:MAG: 4-hydroxy-tetrahydrodipicolinate reductase [Flavobacteriaceae bacterium]